MAYRTKIGSQFRNASKRGVDTIIVRAGTSFPASDVPSSDQRNTEDDMNTEHGEEKTDRDEEVPTLKTFRIAVSPDGKTMGFILGGGDGSEAKYALATGDVPQLVSLIMQTAAQAASLTAQDLTTERLVNADQAITITEMGVGRGRADDEALVSFRVGVFETVFAVNLNTLMGHYEDVKAMTVDTKEPKKTN